MILPLLISYVLLLANAFGMSTGDAAHAPSSSVAMHRHGDDALDTDECNHEMLWKSPSDFDLNLKKFHPRRQEPIGVGSYGVLYKVSTRVSRQVLALKLISKELYTLEEMETELCLSMKLRHPHIVRTYGGFKDENYYYVVMEFIDGPSLLRFTTDESFETVAPSFVL
jgi:serine/threonine protein kinase